MGLDEKKKIVDQWEFLNISHLGILKNISRKQDLLPWESLNLIPDYCLILDVWSCWSLLPARTDCSIDFAASFGVLSRVLSKGSNLWDLWRQTLLRLSWDSWKAAKLCRVFNFTLNYRKTFLSLPEPAMSESDWKCSRAHSSKGSIFG